ncbi:ABC transporter permease [Mucilaginibacter arboris]|uniref:FtsX-like permease family protein n=1 Tax=Mucilaginibacter arboris TaxID=2682090 RepID=A0A7K1SZA6_9SPHI|nr:ABC transporter permease [Mucilaginibacter arboris]MVN22651.1 FtsX-like permease family protein [Mucilaginibacter arboris]
MFKNNLKVAWRNLLKGKVFNLINIAGLSVAVACCILLFLTVDYEFSYDHFHQDLKDIYQVYTTENRSSGIEKNTSMPEPLAPALKAAYPAIKFVSRYGNGQAAVRYKDKQTNYGIKFIDPDFLQIFTFPLAKGNIKTALQDLHGLVITENVAHAVFNQENPVGKTLELNFNGELQNFTVSGVAKDFPDNSSLGFDMLMRFENFPNYEQKMDRWNAGNHSLFVRLQPGIDQASLEKQFIPFTSQHFTESINTIKRDGSIPDASGNVFTLNLLPFAQNHFAANFFGLEGNQVSKVYIIALMAIGIFILLIASINFINLNVARAFTRAREVGVRKTLGAGQWTLIIQFWTETVLVCLVALVAGLLISSLILPGFRTNFRSPVTLGLLLQPAHLSAFFTIFFLVTIVAGFYPAWLMLRYKTVQVLKGTVNTAKPGKVRNVLLVTQFTLSTLLIICTLITWQQMRYMQNKPLGYNRTEVISVPLGREMKGSKAMQLLRDKLQSRSEIVAISGSANNLGLGTDGSTSTHIVGFNYNGREIRTNWQRVDYDYLKTLDMKLLEGRVFSRSFSTDSNSIIINEQMAKQLGGKNLIGKFVTIYDGYPKMQVIGIIRDFNFRSLRDEIEPLSLNMENKSDISYAFIRVKPVNLLSSYDNLKKQWHQIFPNTEFNGSWLNENTERQYRSEKRLSNIFISGATIAILISCIGLLAMAMMTMVQRTKEVGIRKVLGSSVMQIVVLLSQDFIKLVLLASVLAFPVAWLIMNKWLQSFAYRIEISWWIFGLATMIALVIAVATVSFQAVKAALANPVKSLRSE